MGLSFVVSKIDYHLGVKIYCQIQSWLVYDSSLGFYVTCIPSPGIEKLREDTSIIATCIASRLVATKACHERIGLIPEAHDISILFQVAQEAFDGRSYFLID